MYSELIAPVPMDSAATLYYMTGTEDSEDSFAIRGEIDPSIPDKDAYSKRLRYIQQARKSEALSSEEQEIKKGIHSAAERFSGSILLGSCLPAS